MFLLFVYPFTFVYLSTGARPYAMISRVKIEHKAKLQGEICNKTKMTQILILLSQLKCKLRVHKCDLQQNRNYIRFLHFEVHQEAKHVGNVCDMQQEKRVTPKVTQGQSVGNAEIRNKREFKPLSRQYRKKIFRNVKQ